VSLRNAAMITGVSIIVMAIAAGFAVGFVLEGLIVPGDAVATTNNIKTSEMLFRMGIFSWLIILVCDVLAAWGLYIFLKPVNKNLSLLMAWFRLIYTATLGAAIVNFIIVLLLIGSDDYLTILGADQLQAQAQVLLYINAFYGIWSIGLVIFGFHIFLLGYLALKSDYIPNIFGVLLLIAFTGYLIRACSVSQPLFFTKHCR
jgi:hypothetical protein